MICFTQCFNASRNFSIYVFYMKFLAAYMTIFNISDTLQILLLYTVSSRQTCLTCSATKSKCYTHTPGESGGNLAALTIVVFHSLRSPAEVIAAGTEGGAVLGRTSAASAGQAVHPGEEVVFEPPEQFQHQEVFYSKFTFYTQDSKSETSAYNCTYNHVHTHTYKMILPGSDSLACFSFC